MSWPADGKPRFVVVETIGYWTPESVIPRHLRDAPESRTVAVLDRGWCHRTVYRVRSEDFSRGQTRAAAVARAQQLARERCAELNERCR